MQRKVSHRHDELCKKECCVVYLFIRSTNFSADLWKIIRKIRGIWQEYENVLLSVPFASNSVVNL